MMNLIGDLKKSLTNKPILGMIVLAMLVYMGITPSVLADLAAEFATYVTDLGSSLTTSTVDVVADGVTEGVEMTRDVVTEAAQTAADVVSNVEAGARKLSKTASHSKRHATRSHHQSGGSRKYLKLQDGLYHSGDFASNCGGFGADRLQCSHMNLPVSQSIRPHPLVEKNEIDSHYHGGLMPKLSSSFSGAPPVCRTV